MATTTPQAGTSGSLNNAKNWVTVGSALAGAYGDYANSKKGQTVNSTTTRPAWLDSASQGVLDRGAALADRPYTPYGGQRVADLSGNEKQAYGMAAGLGGKYQPLIDRAGTAFSSDALKPYMNPYTEGVLDVNARRINQQYDTQLGSLNAKRGMMDAFGSDRGTLLESQLQRGRAQALSDANVQGLSDAYTQGTNAFYADKQAALNTASTGAALDTNAIGAMNTTGALERGVRQSQNDFDYGQFIESRDWDMNNFSSLLNALNAASGSSGSSTNKTANSPMNIGGTMAGLAQTVAGAYLQGKQPAGTSGETSADTGGAQQIGGLGGNPNAAGGEAAGALGAIGDDASGIGYFTPTQSKVGDGSTGVAPTGEGMDIGGALDKVGNAAGIYTGVKQGGAAGYATAAGNAAELAGYKVPGLSYVGAIDQAAKGDVVGGAYNAAITYAGGPAAIGNALANWINTPGKKDSARVSAVTDELEKQGWTLAAGPAGRSANTLIRDPQGNYYNTGNNDNLKNYARAVTSGGSPEEIQAAWEKFLRENVNTKYKG